MSLVGTDGEQYNASVASSLDRSLDGNDKQYGIVDDFNYRKSDLGTANSGGNKSGNLDDGSELLFDYNRQGAGSFPINQSGKPGLTES